MCACVCILHLSLCYYLINLFFTFISDIILNFRTTYVSSKGEVVSNSKSIALNYFKGWFIVDLLSALPFDFLHASDVLSGEVICIINFV